MARLRFFVVAGLVAGATAFGTSALRATAIIGAVEPTADEELGVWTLNRARHDPPAYGTQIGLDLSGVLPQQPLAVNKNHHRLGALPHAREMLENDYFDHVSPVTGIAANEMAVQNGYDLFGDGLSHDWGSQNFIESIAEGINSVRTYPSALSLLIIDKGVAGAGHRVHLLAMVAGYQKYREIGNGQGGRGQDVRLRHPHGRRERVGYVPHGRRVERPECKWPLRPRRGTRRRDGRRRRRSHDHDDVRGRMVDPGAAELPSTW